MLSISIHRLSTIERIDEITIHSMDVCLYCLRAVINGHCYRVTDADGKPYRRLHLEGVRKDLLGCHIGDIHLLQSSAYDEMIGGPPKDRC